MQQEIAWQISEALRLKLTARAEEEAAQARRSIPRPTRPTCAAGITGTPGRRKASARARALPAGHRSRSRRTRWRYAGLGDAYGAMAYYGHRAARRVPARARRRRARDRARPDLADAHVTLGARQLFGEWNWPAGERAEAGARAQPEACAARTRSCCPHDLRTVRRGARRGARRASSIRSRRFTNMSVALGASFRRPLRRGDHEALRAHPRSGARPRRGRQRPDHVRRSCSGASRTRRGWRRRAALLRGCRSTAAAARGVPRGRRRATGEAARR